MEDVTSPPHSMGSGQPHPINHTRPFFYVQPPSQPYYMYQWQMNNPFNHYGIPGAGMPFARPYMAPYPYMQYPGYVMPHAPMQPIDYRRMFNPHFHPANYDVRFRHHYHHHHQSRVRRETACSEAQTDPSDAVNKLMESLDRLRACGVSLESVKGCNLGMAPKAAGPEGGQGEGLEPLPQRCRPARGKSSDVSSPLPATLFSDSVTAIYSEELGQNLSQEDGWSVGSDGVLPLDSSSVHEEMVVEKPDSCDQSCVPERLYLQTITPDGEDLNAGGAKPRPNCQLRDVPENDGVLTQRIDSPQTGSPEPSGCLSQEMVKQSEVQPSMVSSLPGTVEEKDAPEKPTLDMEDLPYRILRLPVDKVTTTSVLQKVSPLWCVDSVSSSLIPPASYLSSFGNAFYYSYYPQVSQERQSVLSPSLEELSSRDELFSTDLEDLDLLPGHMYTSGGRLLPASGEIRDPDGYVPEGPCQEEFPICPRRKCATCGSRLSKETRRRRTPPVSGLGNCDYPERGDTDEEAIEEEDENEGEALRSVCEPRMTMPSHKQHQARRQPQPLYGRQASKQVLRKGYGEELDDQDHRHQRGPRCCEEHKALAKDQELRHAQSRPHVEKQRREYLVESDEESWESCGTKQRSKSWKSCSSQGQEKPTRRRLPCKTLACPRPRSNDFDESEFPPCQKGRGSTSRRETRC